MTIPEICLIQLKKKSAFQSMLKRRLSRQWRQSMIDELHKLRAQLLSALTINTYVISGVRLGSMQGWSVSPDLGLLLIELIETNNYHAIVEFGSGSSTTLIAIACRNRRARNGLISEQIALEHSAEFAQRTESLLRANDLQDAVNVILAPLVSIDISGEKYQYYDCDSALASLALSVGARVESPHVMIFVDGPPGAINRFARYPALHFVLKHFPSVAMDILLDDTLRADERDTILHWKKELADLGRVFFEIKYPFEKGAFLLRVRPAVQ